jgi:hypothetical protein
MELQEQQADVIAVFTWKPPIINELLLSRVESERQIQTRRPKSEAYFSDPR